ncbi:MAG TPA: hypothetical protein VMT64_04410 [Candidatus Binataceae bacterium]|nr:hypothetical protein [Candidatus Binataceae bacterium]
MLKRIVTATAVSTQAACNDYRLQFAGSGGAAPCFSTTARQ